jgi:hypothetical protein
LIACEFPHLVATKLISGNENQAHPSITTSIALMTNPLRPLACTIFSAKGNNGQVWFGNNEDASFSFKNYINVFPKVSSARFGYYTLSKDKPENGENAQIAGGMNEAGLAFDFNATTLNPVKGMHLKREFPKGDNAILSYILANFEKVEEVASFFQTYWFMFGFRSAQMHLADRFGHFTIISPTGSRILTDAAFQVSTNYDICAEAYSTSCWRYPIAQKILKTQQPSQEVFTDICKKTAQGRHTIYSTVNNLKTGTISVYFSGDYTNAYQTDIHQLMKNGRKSYMISDLIPRNALTLIYSTYQLKGIDAAFAQYNQMSLSSEYKKIVLPNLLEYFTTELNNYDIYPFLVEYIMVDKDADMDLWLVKAAIEVQKGELTRAKGTIETALLAFPGKGDFITQFMEMAIGRFDKDANAEFVLEGHETAKFVIVKSIPVSSNFYPLNNLTFMSKEKGKWVIRLKLPEGIYNYSFIVDGKEVLSNNLPVRDVDNLLKERVRCHQLCLGFTEKTYPLSIELKVPDKEDEVYIVGNQESIFRAPLIMMRKVSDYERSVTVSVHYPAVFKFTAGAGRKEAIIKGIDEQKPLQVDSMSSYKRYEIVGWK